MPELRLFNSLTRKKEPFRPLDPASVRMYVCGPTVYDRAHLGNARPVVVFDVLFRLLRHLHGAEHVTYVRNYTDIDDRIVEKHRATGRPVRAITDETIGWYEADMVGALGTLPPTHTPRCIDYVPQMVAMTERLIAAGHAYVVEGEVFFRVRSDPGYGRLTGRTLEGMRAGERVEVDPRKEDPMDFVLWKPESVEGASFPSPWGPGRPGWHIECSAMAKALLGEVFDIHGGGLDLQFPHHENELAQSCCAHNRDEMARIWLHNEMLQVEGKKMSKSLGNFFTVRDLLDKGYPGEVIRLVLLSTHYRSPMDWTAAKAEEARQTLRKWRALAAGVEPAPSAAPAVLDALCDDLNTWGAITALRDLAKQGDGAALLASAPLLGLLMPELGNWNWQKKRFLDGPPATMTLSASNAELFVRRASETRVPEIGSEPSFKEIEDLIEARKHARKRGDYKRADEIRDGLLAAGVIVRDTGAGAEWELGPGFDAAKLAGLA